MLEWNVSPEIVSIGSFSLRWYGLLFALGFVLSHRILQGVFRREKVSVVHLDRLLIYVALGTVLGARLGHCLFYEPEVYLPDPIRILKIWEGGLASHGAAVGNLLALWLYARRYPELGYLWLLDRITMVIPLAGALIRLGNLFNSEILGKPSTLPWAVVFRRVDNVARHPAQLYESVTYLLIFIYMRMMYENPRVRGKRGLLFGFFLIGVFGSRIIIELLKERQVAFESALPLDMGQLLSIPLVLLGSWLLWRARGHSVQPGTL